MRMKKTLTFFLSCLMAVAAFATDYKGDLKINFPDQKDVAPVVDADRVVTVELTDAANKLYKLSIKDFSFENLVIGDIVINGAKGEAQTDGSVKIATSEYKMTLYNGLIEATIDFEGVISKDENTFMITKLNIATNMVGKVVCEFTGTNVNSSAIKDVVFDGGEYQIYNIAGQRVQDMNQSGIFLIRYANGTTKKIIKK